ncbi:hypothetical protein AAG906_031144 [Vitis piasezkii]
METLILGSFKGGHISHNADRNAASAETYYLVIKFNLPFARPFKRAESVLKTLALFFMQKTVVSVELLCSKCRQKVMKLIGAIEGITSVVLDPSKNTATVIGEADPVKIIKQVRKFKRSAMIVSIGPPKEEKKDDKSVSSQVHIHSLPKICQGCDVWYVVGEDYHICSIL